MRNNRINHIDDLVLALYASGYKYLPKNALEQIEEHLPRCEFCQELLEEAVKKSASWKQYESQSKPPKSRHEVSRMGMNLGPSNTLAYVCDKGMVLNEPSLVAVQRGTAIILNKGKAIGLHAREMIGETQGLFDAVRPLKGGLIRNLEIAEAMLDYFIRKACDRGGLVKPDTVIAVPSGMTAIERRAIIEIVRRVDIQKGYLIDEPIAAAIGAGLPITAASMIVDIGGGTTEVAIMSLADIAVSQSIRIAGDDMDEAVINHLKKTYNLLIGESSAERVKIQIGSAVPLEEELTMVIAGRDTISGLQREIVITSEEIREALRVPIAAIIDTVTGTLEKAEPGLAADLIDNGIHICGGSSLLRGMDTVLANATGLKVKRVDEPITCVVRGASVCLEKPEFLESYCAT